VAKITLTKLFIMKKDFINVFLTFALVAFTATAGFFGHERIVEAETSEIQKVYLDEQLAIEQALIMEAGFAEEEALQAEKNEEIRLNELEQLKVKEDNLAKIAAGAKTAEEKAAAQAAILAEQKRQQELAKVAQEKAIVEAKIAADNAAALQAAKVAEAEAQKIAAEKAAAKAASRKSRAS
jgi:membrane protein involved in colicin uptake